MKKLSFTVKLRRKPSAGRAEQAARAAGRAAVAALVIGLLVQVIHMLLPVVPMAVIAGIAIVAAHKIRDAYDSWQYRRSGGRRAEKLRRRHEGAATRREIRRNLSLATARRKAHWLRPEHAKTPPRQIPSHEVGMLIGYTLSGKEGQR